MTSLTYQWIQLRRLYSTFSQQFKHRNGSAVSNNQKDDACYKPTTFGAVNRLVKSGITRNRHLVHRNIIKAAARFAPFLGKFTARESAMKFRYFAEHPEGSTPRVPSHLYKASQIIQFTQLPLATSSCNVSYSGGHLFDYQSEGQLSCL